MHNIVLAIHIILALLLIVSVLMQRSEGGGLGIGGGNAKTASRGGLDGLGRATWILAGAFMITSLTLTIMATRASGTSNILDSLPTSAPVSTDATSNTNPDNTVPTLPTEAPSN